MIGLRDELGEPAAVVRPGGQPARAAAYRERYGMPFGVVPKARRRRRRVGAGRSLLLACSPGSEWRVLRALQLANFATGLFLDDDELIRGAVRSTASMPMRSSTGSTPRASPTRTRVTSRGKGRGRLAAEAQQKTSTSDGPVRFTAPSSSSTTTGADSSRVAGSPCWRMTCC